MSKLKCDPCSFAGLDVDAVEEIEQEIIGPDGEKSPKQKIGVCKECLKAMGFKNGKGHKHKDI